MGRFGGAGGKRQSRYNWRGERATAPGDVTTTGQEGTRREALTSSMSGAGKYSRHAARKAASHATAVYREKLRHRRPGRSNGEEAVKHGNGGGGSAQPADSDGSRETHRFAASRDHVENGLTKTEAMARHGIASIASLERWCRDYRSGGPEALRPKP